MVIGRENALFIANTISADELNHYNLGGSMYIAKQISVWERIRERLFKKYRLECEQKQKQIIREMVTTGKDDLIVWV